MRVIAGRYKGRRLASPAWPGLRPSSDKLKGSLFEILGAAVPGARVLDGFAGSGALGIEALSRGASEVLFIDADARAIALTEENLRRCGVARGYAMMRGELAGTLLQLPATLLFDVILLDPPYDDPAAGAAVEAAASRVTPDGLLVLEHARRTAPPKAAGDLVLARQVRSGDSVLSFYRRPAGPRGTSRAEGHARSGGVMTNQGGRIAVYPGSFDPLTNGHVDIILRGARLFDRIVVAILRNAEKQPLFSTEERVDTAREVFRAWPNVEVEDFDGLLVDYAVRKQASVIVRGLRAVSDFEYELQMALMNRRMGPAIETVFMMPAEQYTYVSSRLIKEVFGLGGPVTGLVPEIVETRLREKRSEHKV